MTNELSMHNVNSNSDLPEMRLGCLVRQLLLILFICVSSISMAEPVKIVYETDFTFDVDDVGALAMLHALADEGEAEILGVSYNEVHKDAVKAIDAVNTWYRRGDLPIGRYDKPLSSADKSGYLTTVANRFPNDGTPTMPSLVMYKKVLEAQPDDSVVISSVGFTNNLYDLIRDTRGLQLVKDKVKLLVIMGFHRNDGFNLSRHDTADEADHVIRNWPSRVVISFAGGDTCTGNGLLRTPIDNPVRGAYVAATPWLVKEHGVGNRCNNTGEKVNQPSWDQVSTLFAVRFETNKGNLFRLKSDGTVNTRGHSPIDYRPGKLELLITDLPSAKAEIERLMVKPPRAAADQPEVPKKLTK